MAAASPALLAHGCVHVIGLDGVRRQAGGRWPLICLGVHVRLESLLRARLAPTDFFTRIADEAYLVTMPASDPDGSAALCLRTAYDLHMSFFGECDLGDVEVSTASDGGGNTLVLERLPPERILRLCGKAGIQVLAPPQDARPPQEMRPIEPTADRLADDAADDASARREATLSVDHDFMPVWCVPTNAVTTYICQARTITPPGRSDPIHPSLLSSKELTQVELSCLHAGIAQLARSIRQGNRFLLSVRISFDVLGSPAGRSEFLAACRNLFFDYRQYLGVTIVHVPPGVAQTRLIDMVNMLRPFVRGVAATMAPKGRVWTAYHGVGLRAIGLDLDEFAEPFGQDDADQLARHAKLMNLGTFLAGVHDAHLLGICAATGIQNLSGSAVAPACDEPRGMWRLTLDDILRADAVAV